VTTPNVWAVVLAAGASTRMGRPKLALPWGETTVLGQVLANLATSPVGGVVLVTGCDAAMLEPIVGAHAHAVSIAFNANWAAGMTNSLQAGLRSVPAEPDGVLVVLGDMPMAGSDIMTAVVTAFDGDVADAVVPVMGHRHGHPVLLGPRAIEAVLALESTEAPRRALDKLRVRWIDIDDRAILSDLDDMTDYEAWRL
jgi:molybdenum cofactor cytidylyltransferase